MFGNVSQLWHVAVLLLKFMLISFMFNLLLICLNDLNAAMCY